MTRVLVAPLDWGLGHATRCIPLINSLIKRGCEVIIAGNGRSLELLCLEFPSLKTELLPGYDPQYPRSGPMVFAMIRQIPKFLEVIKKEHECVEAVVSHHQIDLVISDNRYGCWSSKVTSVFITHQSNILMPKRFGWLSGIVRTFNERLIKRFSQYWIPDFPGLHSLAGVLAESGHLQRSMPFRHIGAISRFKYSNSTQKNYDLLCIFSGPEPQRSIFEALVTRQLNGLAIRVAVVRGVPAKEKKSPLSLRADVFDMLTTQQLQALIDQSEIILARSGFSTVMDLACVRKKAIFVPTPGQTEQEYLAGRLMEQGIAFSAKQRNFDLGKALREVQTFKGFEDFPEGTTLLDNALSEVLR